MRTKTIEPMMQEVCALVRSLLRARPLVLVSRVGLRCLVSA